MRILVSIANIAVAAIVVLSIWPFVTGEFGVDLPTANEVSWTYSNGNLTLAAPIRINNGGFYDVNDVVVYASARNQTGYEIFNSTSDWGTIPAGSIVPERLSFTLDLPKLLRDRSDWMIFHPDTFDVHVTISAKYTLRLVLFTADYQVPIPWDGLIQAMGFGTPSLVNSSGIYGVQVPYYIQTSELLHGLSGEFSISLRNGTGTTISTVAQGVTLGINYSNVLSLGANYTAAMDLLMNNQTLTAEIIVRFATAFQVTTVKQINWIAPMHW